MANSITLFKKYIDLLDEVYQSASVTSALDGDMTLVQMGANTNEIVIPKISMDGLADYDRNGGYVHGDALELTAPTTIRNSGTVYSEPLITVYGSGDVTLNINGNPYPLRNVQESITIDSEMMEVFKEDTNQNGKYGGVEFPRFEVGKNEISWTGNVSKIKIQPRWRWL